MPASPPTHQIHATAVAIDGYGVLLRGPSGAGKSDLALRLIDRGARLVADDRVDLAARAGFLVASAPARIAGLIEVRGVGIVRRDALRTASVRLLVDLVAAHEVERLPKAMVQDIFCVSLPLIRLDPFEASAAIKVEIALEYALAGMDTTP